MSEDDSTLAPDGSDKPAEKRRSWLDRLSSAFSGEPSTRDDLLAILRDAQSDGLIASDTLRMMEGAIAVAELTVGDVMVPRAQMVSLPVEARFLDLMKDVVESGHSRFPVHGENKDEILGILLAKDLLRCMLDPQVEVRSLVRPAVFIPESKRLNVLLREFRVNRNHQVIIVDEHGGIAGLVTMENVLEQIVGDIEDEYDEDAEQTIFADGEGRWRVMASTDIDRFNEAFNSHLETDEYDTVGGWLADELDHIPRRGDVVERDDLTIQVVRADARRALWLSVHTR